MEHFAHSLEDASPDRWQSLEEHLAQVAELAESFAETFSSGTWGRALGKTHDYGKYSEAFQKYLYHANGLEHPEYGAFRGEDKQHAIHGARLAMRQAPGGVAKCMAYCLAGHHRGLPDWHNSSGGAFLRRYLDESYRLPSIDEKLPVDWLGRQQFPDGAKPPIALPADGRNTNFALMFFIRMIFSCLVDADYLDTEAFIEPDKSADRDGYPDLKELKRRFDRYYTRFDDPSPSDLNQARTEMYQHCVAAGKLPPGLFSLTMPTGGGKSLASLAFALEHALEHDLARVFFVIPFTSIIEQNAKVFRDAVGQDAVLEHHSNFIADDDDHRTKLASENWDAPLVVTTNVQLFDSLFANRTSKTRKLHNLASSVIILDEAQALPPGKLRPCLAALDELARNYRCSIVLCTATQPALTKQDGFDGGLDNVREITPEPKRYFDDLRRTRVVVEQDPIDDEGLAARVAESEQALVIVNTRAHAQNIFRLLGCEEGTYHLSALMTPRHRGEKIAEIRERLKKEERCLVVSTQLIEAGVDVDFPIVYRALAGLDSIAQAAGRCNREGKQPVADTIVFVPKDVKPRHFAQMVNVAREILPDHADDLLSPEAIREFFQGYYWQQGDRLDEKGILGICKACTRLEFPFEEIARKFHLIDQQGESVIIPHDEQCGRLIDQWRNIGPQRGLMRRLQQYSVNVYDQDIQRLRERGNVLPLAAFGDFGGEVRETQGPYVLQNMRLYDSHCGLMIDGPDSGGEQFSCAGDGGSPLVV